jgi:hypothetical protein
MMEFGNHLQSTFVAHSHIHAFTRPSVSATLQTYSSQHAFISCSNAATPLSSGQAGDCCSPLHGRPAKLVAILFAIYAPTCPANSCFCRSCCCIDTWHSHPSAASSAQDARWLQRRLLHNPAGRPCRHRSHHHLLLLGTPQGPHEAEERSHPQRHSRPRRLS